MIKIDPFVTEYRSKGNHDFRITVIGTKVIDDVQWVWHTTTLCDYPCSDIAEDFLRGIEPVPNFFEEGKEYQYSNYPQRYVVHHVHEIDGVNVAVVARNGNFLLLTQSDWDAGQYKEI